MNVVVTGGSGHVGRHVLRALIAAGHTVVNVDRQPTPAVECKFRRVDMSDLGQVYGACAGADAIIHLAAIPHPLHDPPETVFRNNVTATFNVLQAADTLGIRRVVYAGSESALGFPFAPVRFSPDYLPIDEKHPLRPRDAYGLSKQIGETICQTFSTRSGIVTVILRLSYVMDEDTYTPWAKPLLDAPADGAFNLWGYVDARDAASAFVSALTAPVADCQAYYIAAPEALAREPFAKLVQQYLPNPERIEWRSDRAHVRAALDCAKAARDLAFAPQYRWQMFLD